MITRSLTYLIFQVNSAGIVVNGTAESTSLKDYDLQMNINVRYQEIKTFFHSFIYFYCVFLITLLDFKVILEMWRLYYPFLRLLLFENFLSGQFFI